jgi:hypothetical protein
MGKGGRKRRNEENKEKENLGKVERKVLTWLGGRGWRRGELRVNGITK